MNSRKRKSTTSSTKAKRAKDELPPASTSHLDSELCLKARALISRNRFVTILGPDGSGRTSLAIFAASKSKPIFVHINDQLDSISLFGSYKTSGIPGDFVWEETLFSKNIQEPNSLVILKGFESATSDLISSVLRLSENGFYPLCGARTIRMHETSRIVAIVSKSKDFSLPKAITDYPFSLTTSEYETEQVVRLITSQIELSVESVRKYHEVFKSINAIISTLPPNERRLAVGDFFTACKRLCSQNDLSPTKAFMELHDSWILHLSRLDQQTEAAQLVSNCFSLSNSDVNFVRNVRVVEIERSEDFITIGRAKLPICKTNEPNQIVTTCALTRDYRNLLERLAVCVEMNEPVLLNGETGIGKTKIVQQLARYVNAELLVINMSLDSDAADLIGGYKPASIQSIVRHYMTSFFALLDGSSKHELLKSRLIDLHKSNQNAKLLDTIVEICMRAMKEGNRDNLHLWGAIYARGQRIISFITSTSGGTPFAYVSGIISRAIKDGHWLLIDEINMASVECLNSIASLLSEHETLGKTSGFRLFACMNPANDSGKRLLSSFIRSKFTEFFVVETREKSQLCEIINHYVPNFQSSEQLAEFYLELCEKLPKKFSLRNLCRSLLLSKDDIFDDKSYSLHVALELGFSSGSDENAREVQSLIQKHVGSKKTLKAKSAAKKGFVQIEGVNFPRGPHKSVDNENFLRTDSVRANLQRISCATASGRFPVLLEGETSAGKTSILTYLAEFTGHKLHRINNHEHTDVQEYLGSYVADENNQLVFQDGVLLQAMQSGDWVILDELNLAPTEVLEALNRLLDDNREVYVPERDEVVKAHPQFRLFATQNPIGRYSGRKRLSRAFLNRFVVLNIQQPPNNELIEIVCKRCKVHKTAADIMIGVMEKLKEMRSTMNLFSSTDSFMTLRDLFRWGNRFSNYKDHTDWKKIIADQGYLLLAGRCRRLDDRLKIQQVIAQATKRTIDVDSLFSLQSPYFPKNIQLDDGFNKHIILTLSMRQMIIQCAQAFEANEPVLFVGETGCGKTSVCYLLAKDGLETLNLHERIDTSDFLGKIRPTNDGLFKWEDGVVVRAMKAGKLLLLDEISLAQDSVLERLNPLLETDRKLLLTDSGASTELIIAKSGFQFVATMNPGGDHGKKELSKALRNRFTEIWCDFEFNEDDVLAIIQRRMELSSGNKFDKTTLVSLAKLFTKFFGYFNRKYAPFFKSGFAVRDAIVIADTVCNLLSHLSVFDAAYNTLSAHLFDALPMLPFRGFKIAISEIIDDCQKHFLSLFNEIKLDSVTIQPDAFDFDLSVHLLDSGVQIGKFFISNGQFEQRWPKNYCFDAPTASLNVMRVARALSSEKPIMLEGTPGAGKSSLVKALAELTGHQLIRINLSEQTEVSDLFGTDVPITLEDGKTSFVWQDGPVLKAIKNGAWLLLDEMNLASQSILEAMNSCFDFRNEIYIAELGRRFQINRNGNCRFFACQNSAKQGGGRKALPKSFLNRFTKIYVSPMTENDMLAIVEQCLSESSTYTADYYIKLHNMANGLISTSCGNSYAGAPFDYNLRDLLRLIDSLKILSLDVAFDLLYIQRLHKEEEKTRLRNKVFMELIGRECCIPSPMIRILDSETIDFGGSIQLQRYSDFNVDADNYFSDSTRLLACQTGILQKLVSCVNCDFLTLLTGPSYSGKRTTVELLARFANVPLRVMQMNSETDAQDLLGSYEQIFCGKRLKDYADELKQLLHDYASDIEDKILLTKLDTLIRLDNPNDMRVMAFDILKNVSDTDLLKQAEILAKSIANETLHFEWIDSDFVQAYTKGEWLLIEDVNVCSSAVLDRLNSCLEKDGELVINEKADGNFNTVMRHPRFRVFFTMSPNRGAISAAMRNRAVEVYMTTNETFMSSVSDKIRLLAGNGSEISMALQLNIDTIKDYSLKQLLNFSGIDERSAIQSSIVESSYVQSLVDASNKDSSLPSIGLSLTGHLQSFYENAWFHLVRLGDPALIFFYSRLITGMTAEKALLIALSDESITLDQFTSCSQISSIDAHSDTTLLAISTLDSETDNEFNKYLVSHLWLYLRWVFERRSADIDSCLKASQADQLNIKNASVCLYDCIAEALRDAHDKFVQFSDIQTLLKIAFELLTFNVLLRSKWDNSVGDVAVLKITRQLQSLGLSSLLTNDEVHSSVAAILKFSAIANRPLNWNQICLLPENSIALFNSNADVLVAENRLTDLLQCEKSPLFEESSEFIVNVTNQLNLFLSIVCQFDAENCDFNLAILDFSTNALSVFKYLNEGLRRQSFELSLLNSRLNYGDISLPVSSVYRSSVMNGPLSAFWREMNYDRSLHDIPIGKLVRFSDKLASLKEFVWQFSISNAKIKQILSARINPLDKQIAEFDAANRDDKRMVFLGLERMKSHAPIEAIDPILSVFADRELTKSSMDVLLAHYEVLKNYTRVIFAEPSDPNLNVAFDKPELPNHNQYSLFIRQRYSEALELTRKFNELGENCRPQNSKYQQLASLICDFINNAQRFCDNFNSEYLPNFIETLNRHRVKLLSEFFYYPDVILPHLFGTLELEYQLNKRAYEESSQYQLAHCYTLQVCLQTLKDLFAEHTFLGQDDFVNNVRFHLSLKSPLPEHIQYRLLFTTLDCLTPKVDQNLTATIFDWLATRWLLWYESHSEKRKELYEYRKTARLNREITETETDEMPDMEMIEIRQLLPDFSKLTFDETSDPPKKQEILNDTQLFNALTAFIRSGIKVSNSFYASIPVYTESVYLPAMSYCSMFENLVSFDAELESIFSVHHLIELNDIITSNTQSDRILNVYKHSDTTAILNCINKIALLKAKVLMHKDEFPENTVLDDLLRCIELFLSTPCDNPQMYFASSLEKLLEKSELWERNVPRQYSLGSELTPLREILVEWRKLEVLCWSDILNSVGSQLSQNCMLTAWPLIESFTRQSDTSESYEKNLLAMLLQWLNDSSLFDLKTRLDVCRLLVVLLKFNGCRLHLISKIESISRFFAQFLPRLEIRAKEERSEAEEKLQNLVQVARYTDLNIWSVKDSTERVHNQLCQIIHKFKIGSNKAALSVFIEEFPAVPDFELDADSNQDTSFAHNYGNIVSQLKSNFEALISMKLIEDMTQNVCDLRSLLNEDVNYSEVERTIKEQGIVDEEKIQEALKKAHGSELFRRQRAIANLKKLASGYGINFREGFGTEDLNELALNCLEESVTQKLKQLVPMSVCSRNIAIKLHSEFNFQQKPHLKSQLPERSFNTLRGIVEFGLSSIVNTNNHLKALDTMQASLSLTQSNLGRLIEIQKINSNGYNHKLLCDQVLLAFMDFAQMKHEFNIVCRYLSARPKEIASENVLFDSPALQFADDLCAKMNTLLQCTEGKLLKWIERKDGSFWIWQIDSIDQLSAFVANELKQFEEVVNRLKFEAEHCLSLFLKRYEQFRKRIMQMASETELNGSRSVNDFDIESLKLKIQSVYRIVEKNNSDKIDPMKRLRQTLQDIEAANLVEVENRLSTHVQELGVSTFLSNSSELLSVVSVFVDVLMVLKTHVTRFLETFTVFYINFCSIVYHFVNKGLVNPIPVADKSAEGEGKSIEEGSGDASGMGSGEGQKDVGDQIEETGQLEDLEGQNDDETKEKPSDSDKPIEMEDDFAADLEGLDADENDNDGEHEEDSTEQADWDVGDIGEQEDEKQLDPKLWDNSAADTQQMDQEDQGANEETGELAANEQKDVTEFDQKSVEEENDGSETADEEMENIDDIQLDAAETDQEMDETEQTAEQANDESESVDEMDQQQEEASQPEQSEEQADVDQSNDNTYQKDAFGQKSLDNVNCANEDQSASAENEASEGGEQGEQMSMGEKQGQTVAQKSEEMETDEPTETNLMANISSRNQTCDALEMVDESEIVDEVADEPSEEKGNRFVDAEESKKSKNDRQVIQSATIEQAAFSKDKIHKDRESEKENIGKAIELGELKTTSYYLNEPVVGLRLENDFVRSGENAILALKSSLENVSESDQRWSVIEETVEVEAAELAEQLRIIIEPTTATKLQGDYKTGKRLNMRRLIPYIASDYRKDRIWLRRTKMDKRNCNVAMAVDCSSSMNDNLATELTAQSIALLNKSFELLQIGQISVVKFGTDVQILRDFGEDIDEFGPKLLQSLKFDEPRTDIVKLLNCMVAHFEEARVNSTNVSDQLLIILGDGRFSGASSSQVRNSVGRLFDEGVTVLYVILDNPASSIFNVKVFKNKQLVSYMHDFPFAFYTVVQNIAMVPVAVAEALKQFVELRNC